MQEAAQAFCALSAIPKKPFIRRISQYDTVGNKQQQLKFNFKERLELYKLGKKPRKMIRLKFDHIIKSSLPLLNESKKTASNYGLDFDRNGTFVFRSTLKSSASCEYFNGSKSTNRRDATADDYPQPRINKTNMLKRQHQKTKSQQQTPIPEERWFKSTIAKLAEDADFAHSHHTFQKRRIMNEIRCLQNETQLTKQRVQLQRLMRNVEEESMSKYETYLKVIEKDLYKAVGGGRSE